MKLIMETWRFYLSTILNEQFDPESIKGASTTVNSSANSSVNTDSKPKQNDTEKEDFIPDQVIAYLVKGNEKKPVTMNDALWFAKMVHGETYGTGTEEEVRYMMWSLINRLGRGWWNFELSDYIQAYSQPISRSWIDGGSRCSAEKQKKLKQKEAAFKQRNPKKSFYNPCAKAYLKKRAEFRSLDYNTVNQNILSWVLKLLRGEIPSPPEPVSGWFANFMFNKNADSSGVWVGGEGEESELRKVAEVRKNSYYERLDKESENVTVEPVN